MAKKTLSRAIKITRIDEKDKLPGCRKICEDTVHGTLITTFAGHNSLPVVMIDNDPAQRYTITLQEILRTTATAGLKEKLKGAKHGNTGRD